jgi:hypothetical protein
MAITGCRLPLRLRDQGLVAGVAPLYPRPHPPNGPRRAGETDGRIARAAARTTVGADAAEVKAETPRRNAAIKAASSAMRWSQRELQWNQTPTDFGAPAHPAKGT